MAKNKNTTQIPNRKKVKVEKTSQIIQRVTKHTKTKQVTKKIKSSLKLVETPDYKIASETLNPTNKASDAIKITATNQSADEIVARKSPYLINLKNPNQSFVEPEVVTKGRVASIPPKVIVKPPKYLPNKSTNKFSVDFIASAPAENKFGKVFLPFFHLSSRLKTKPTDSPDINNHLESSNTPEIAVDVNEEIEDIFAPPRKSGVKAASFIKIAYKPLIVFGLVALLLVVPLQAYTYFQQLQDTKDKILVLGNDAIDSLKAAQEAATNFDLSRASSEFVEAKNNFSLAKRQINDLNVVTIEVLKLIPGVDKSVAAGIHLLNAGEILAEIGQVMSDAANNFIANPNNDYYESLVQLDSSFKIALDKFQQAKQEINQIEAKDLPAQHQETFQKVKMVLPEIEKSLLQLSRLNYAILKVLGHEQWQRYLVMFANNNELRAVGGFLGSFSLVDIDRGKIKKMEIPAGGTYDVQGQLIPHLISPEPLHLINPRWEFHDSNWWPDFPTTAKKIQWFYQNAGGPSSDGVILITAELMTRILEVVGPVEMAQYDRTIDATNFVQETQKIVELEYDKELNRPKQFIADMSPSILEKVFNTKGQDFIKLLGVLKEGLNEKQLVIYFNNPEIESIILSLGWGGKIEGTEGDYLAVIHTNIAGGKTDAVISDRIVHEALVQDDGTIIDTVKLARTHNGKKDQDLFTGVQNNSYIRFYVPGGSTLLEASGFGKPDEKLFESPPENYMPDIDLMSIEVNKKVDETTGTDIYWENGKTVFGNWLMLKPGETKEVTIKYKLPFKLIGDVIKDSNQAFYYSLKAQKQAGTIASDFSSSLTLNKSLMTVAKFPANVSENDGKILFNDKLLTDKFYSVVLKAK